MYDLTIKAESFVELRQKLVDALTVMMNPDTTKDRIITEKTEPIKVAPVQAAPTPQQTVPTVPVAQAPQYSQEQLSIAGVQLMDAGKQNEVYALMDRFGVQMITQLPQERYGEFAQALRALGAQL